MIALDESLVDYALLFALGSDNSDEVNFICNRVAEAVPQMQLSLVLHCEQRIEDYFKKADPDYLKLSPLRRLLELLNGKRAEFIEK